MLQFNRFSGIQAQRDVLGAGSRGCVGSHTSMGKGGFLGPKPQSQNPLDLSPGLWFGGVGSPNHSPRTPWILALDCALGCLEPKPQSHTPRFLALDCGLGVLGVRTTVWRLLERVLERVGECWRGLDGFEVTKPQLQKPKNVYRGVLFQTFECTN